MFKEPITFTRARAFGFVGARAHARILAGTHLHALLCAAVDAVVTGCERVSPPATITTTGNTGEETRRAHARQPRGFLKHARTQATRPQRKPFSHQMHEMLLVVVVVVHASMRACVNSLHRPMWSEAIQIDR